MHGGQAIGNPMKLLRQPLDLYPGRLKLDRDWMGIITLNACQRTRLCLPKFI